MDFEFTADHIAFREMAADFARDKLAPMADTWDEQDYFPIEVLREAAALGMAGMMAREDIGGTQLTRLDSALLFEQLATGCVSTSAFLSIHNMVTSLVDRYANPDLRFKWGPKLTSMQVL